jgi:hypothetical protein
MKHVVIYEICDQEIFDLREHILVARIREAENLSPAGDLIRGYEPSVMETCNIIGRKTNLYS